VAGGMGVALVTRIIADANRPGVVFRDLTGIGAPVEYELAIAYGRRRRCWCVHGRDPLPPEFGAAPAAN